MPSRLLVRCVLAFALAATAVPSRAREVTLEHKGIGLNANLELAADRKIADGVVLITHGTLAHRGMVIIGDLQNLLKDRGYSSLAINLGLGVGNRQGMYDCKTTHRHRHADAADEIGAWIGWLKEQGATRVALVGHSRGGAQTALYAAERDNALVKAVVLLAPALPDANPDAGYRKRYQKPLAPVLAKAQKLVQDGKGDTVLEHTDFLYCPDTSVTAEAFASYYSPDTRADTLSLIRKSRKPTLVVVASNDTVVLGLDKKVAPLADGKRVQMKTIDGADHFFGNLYAEDAADTIDAFLKGTGY